MKKVKLNKLKKINAKINQKKGRISSVFIDPINKKIAGIKIKSNEEKIILPATVIPDIVENRTVYNSLETLRLDIIQVIPFMVIAYSGKVIGEFFDLEFDIYTGDIMEIYIKISDDQKIKYKGDDILLFGQTVIVVNQDEMLDLSSKTTKPTKPKKSKISLDKAENQHADDLVKRQLQYLIGDEAQKDIKKSDGSIIINAGQIIDEPAIRKVIKAGKVMELLDTEQATYAYRNR